MNAYFRFQAYEIIKVKNTMPCEILTKIPPQKDSQYSLRNSATLQGGSFKISYMVQKIYRVWDQKLARFTNRIKQILCFLHYSKGKFVNGRSRKVSCRLCKTYERNIGFL